jgi:lipoyl(octanoyl) transferase
MNQRALTSLTPITHKIKDNWEISDFGQTDYEPMWQAMKALTQQRDEKTLDQIWLTTHSPVYTLGLAGQEKHLLTETNIPIVKTDRGGQITYHGPGQQMVYVLCDLKRQHLWVKEWVYLLEQTLIDALQCWGLQAARFSGRPGVYVQERKIAALGIKVSRGCSYHGFALNVDVDLSAFEAINPCGYSDQQTTSLAKEGVFVSWPNIQETLVSCLINQLTNRAS